MGYRSDVAWVAHVPDKVKYEMFLARARAHCEKFKYDWVHFTIDPDRHLIHFKAEDAKWYDSYEDVRNIMALVESIEDGFDGVYRFCRIGEDTDDNEDRCSDETDFTINGVSDWIGDYIGIRRAIDTDAMPLKLEPIKETTDAA